jgi:hypothetical protein
MEEIKLMLQLYSETQAKLKFAVPSVLTICKYLTYNHLNIFFC